MATSLLSRRLFSGRILLPSPSLRLLSTSPGPDTFSSPDHDTFASPDPTSSSQERSFESRRLDGGVDPGLYKAILVGKVGQAPMQRRLRDGKDLVFFSLATGGIRNNRRPLPHERPEEYDARCTVQWHRICVYPGRLIPIALRIVKPGAMMYLEGNIESKVFADPATGVVRRMREIAIRGNGRLLYLSSDEEGPTLDDGMARSVGYY